jgi:D-alanyl-D-alanine carboxypeptidase
MMAAFFEQTGYNNVLLSTAYRSYQDQVNSGSSVPAGFSDSHAGLSGALRVFDSHGKTADLSSDPVYNWIYEHCHEYGFIVRYPDGKEALTGVSDYNYYFRYVGYVHAYAMKLNDMCLEEYILYVQGYSMEAPLTVTGEDGTTHEIYHVPAATGGMDTEIPVPTEYAYAISGDNAGGFIVTVTLP